MFSNVLHGHRGREGGGTATINGFKNICGTPIQRGFWEGKVRENVCSKRVEIK